MTGWSADRATTRAGLRRATALTSVAGGAWGLLVGLGALDLVPRGVLHPVDGRTGSVAAAITIAAATLALVAGASALRHPAVACGLLSVAALIGVMGVGAAFTGPTLVLCAAWLLALGAIEDPLADEPAVPPRVSESGV